MRSCDPQHFHSVSAMVGDITANGIDGNSQPVIVESTSKSKGTITTLD